MRPAVATAREIRATHEKIDDTLAALKPLCGNVWLAFDRSTGFHWLIEAASVRPISGRRSRVQELGAFGLATVCSRTGEPSFQVEEADTLLWEMPGECLHVREGAFRGSEIVLERIDGVEAPTMTDNALTRMEAAGERPRVISVGHGRYLEVPEAMLATGSVDVDAELVLIDATVDSRRSLRGPSHGTVEVFQSLDRRLRELSRCDDVHSFVWIAVLQGEIARLTRSLDD